MRVANFLQQMAIALRVLKVGIFRAMMLAFIILAAHPRTAEALTNAPHTHSLKTLYAFCALPNCADGEGLEGGLLTDARGNIFGVAAGGGNSSGINSSGTIFELKPTGKGARRLKVLYRFCKRPDCADGKTPTTGLIEDAAGNLYGTTQNGGTSGYGTVFELVNQSGKRRWHLHTLHVFSRQAGDGGSPSGRLTYAGAASGSPYDGVSALYGTTQTGGAHDLGMVFQLLRSNGHWAFDALYSFKGSSDGTTPFAGVIVDASGNLFGTTQSGGFANGGLIFELSQSGSTWNEVVLHQFCSMSDCSDARTPWGVLTMDAAGNIFGTTLFGGPHGGGSLFKLAPDSSFSTLHYFCNHNDECLDGQGPTTGVTLDASGNIFGVTAHGGTYGDGVAYRYATNGSYHVLYAFCSLSNCLDGFAPEGELLLTRTGRLLGSTLGGGVNSPQFHDGGIIYELKP